MGLGTPGDIGRELLQRLAADRRDALLHQRQPRRAQVQFVAQRAQLQLLQALAGAAKILLVLAQREFGHALPPLGGVSQAAGLGELGRLARHGHQGHRQFVDAALQVGEAQLGPHRLRQRSREIRRNGLDALTQLAHGQALLLERGFQRFDVGGARQPRAPGGERLARVDGQLGLQRRGAGRGIGRFGAQGFTPLFDDLRLGLGGGGGLLHVGERLFLRTGIAAALGTAQAQGQ